MTSSDLTTPRIFEARLPALIIGVGALAICAIALFFDPLHALRGYLIGWLFCLGISIGSMCIVMMHHLTGGAWGWLVRRPAESAGLTFLLLAILFIPIAIGAKVLFPWASTAAAAESVLVRHREPYFHTALTLFRALVFFVLWIVWGWRLHALSLEYDRTLDPTIASKLRRYSASGLVMVFITMSLAGMDWIASREVDWYSSTFGLALIVGQGVAGTAFLIVMLQLLRNAPRVSDAIKEKNRFHDLGNLLLTVVVLWAYISFAQLLVIWMGNMQDDITWFYHRTHRGWKVIAILLITIHFGLPFILLLFQGSKRNLRILATIAGGLLFMRAIDVIWMIVPSSRASAPRIISWLDPIGIVGVFGIWFSVFLTLLKRHPLIPLAFERVIEIVPYGRSKERQPAA